MLERIGKMLAVAAFGTCTIAATLLPGREEIVVPGTLTRCLELGRAIRRAREAGEDPVRAAVQFTGGWLLFEGMVAGKDRDGYMFGTSHIQGTGDYTGHTDVRFSLAGRAGMADTGLYLQKNGAISRRGKPTSELPLACRCCKIGVNRRPGMVHISSGGRVANPTFLREFPESR
ncbi:MAG: hypothetical protein ACPL7G_12460 [Chloroflexia bacterium]